ncbi:hypothetical protein MTR67_011834 [Solanum verrucosum]|uniref:Uncharacterized protein n=1 Tax=Solanum verrucosum TaxID=315347 RepID=A0AAF0Q7J8_SOLVR|nr:hypothetical protein MTR67_011834 [Solanum verrucosum]
MITLWDNIQSFKRLDGESILETWLRFKKLVLQCLTHDLPDNVLLQYFYRSLDSVNKGVANQLSPGGLMQQPYIIAAKLLDGMTKINRVWYTREDQGPEHRLTLLLRVTNTISYQGYWLWIEEQSKDTNLQKGMKQTERMNKGEPGDHLASRRMDI